MKKEQILQYKVPVNNVPAKDVLGIILRNLPLRGFEDYQEEK